MGAKIYSQFIKTVSLKFLMHVLKMQKKRKCFLNKLAAMDLYTEVVKSAAVKKSALGRILKKNPAPLDVFLFFFFWR